MFQMNVEVRAIGTELVRHVRLVQLLRSRMTEWNPSGLDWSGTSLLAHLVRGGPKRQGELAACAMLDPSTVSRQVGQLIRLGMAERRPDPADGRAVQLVATEAGQRCYAEIAERREQLVGEVLAGWSEQDLDTFGRLLRELNDAFEARLPDPSGSGVRRPLTRPEEN